MECDDTGCLLVHFIPMTIFFYYYYYYIPVVEIWSSGMKVIVFFIYHSCKPHQCNLDN